MVWVGTQEAYHGVVVVFPLADLANFAGASRRELSTDGFSKAKEQKLTTCCLNSPAKEK